MKRSNFLQALAGVFAIPFVPKIESHVESHGESHDEEYAGEWWLDHLLLAAHLEGREITAVVGNHAFWLEFQERFPPKWEYEHWAIPPTVTVYFAPTGEVRMLKSWQCPEIELNDLGVALIEKLPDSWGAGYPYV